MSSGSDDNYKKFTAQDTEVLGISANAIFSQKAFVDFTKVQHPLLSDRDGKVMNAFGVWDADRRLAKRSYIIIDKEGIVRYKNVRPSNSEKDLLGTETLLSEVKKINAAK
jgi:peroxiredoxin Q/BCP